MEPTGKRQDSLFLYLLILTGFFFLLEVSFFIQCNKVYLSDFTFVSDKLQIPTIIWKNVSIFILTQIIIHLAYCYIIYLITASLSFMFGIKQKLGLGIFLWVIGTSTILIANAVFFPNSKFSYLLNFFLPDSQSTILIMLVLGGVCVLIIFFALLGFYARFKKAINIIILLMAIGVPAYIFFRPIPNYAPAILPPNKPNVFIIGVDSLRPDFLGFFGHQKLTPFFDAFLNQSTVFSEAITPLARTFPSWVSLLTGEYPHRNGVRFNLADPTLIDLSNTLPAILERNGYETIYASDETRFSNIDKNFGFDEIITPPMGLNDFLIGTFNDFPISNLLINTILGKWLFPYSYANRPVFFTYNPNSFLHLLEPILKKQRDKPLFLSVHFCLTHSPYIWASLPAENLNATERYEKSVMRVDRQVDDFFDMLKQYNLLNHAIVVLLSDHGEALGLSGDRITEEDLFDSHTKPPQFYPPSLDDEKINQSAGHGTDVLGLTQYHILLAFKLYGFGTQQRGVVSGVVSLLDVKPTILKLLDIENNSTSNLTDFIKGKSKEVSLIEHQFIESDFSPEALRTVYPEIRRVVLEGIDLFKIDHHSLRLTVKQQMGQMIINSKQYADIYGDWMLALYPQNKSYRMPILINLQTGKWTNNLESLFAQNSPAKLMLKSLKDFYGDEIGLV